MLYVYVLVVLLVPIIVMFRRELLVAQSTSRIILIASAILFGTGLLLHFTDIGRDSPSGALLTRLFSYGLFRCLRKIFLRRFRREPMDTYLDMRSKLAWDRAFNVFFLLYLGSWC
jgi:hypothetical protein